MTHAFHFVVLFCAFFWRPSKPLFWSTTRRSSHEFAWTYSLGPAVQPLKLVVDGVRPTRNSDLTAECINEVIHIINPWLLTTEIWKRLHRTKTDQNMQNHIVHIP